MIGLAIMVYEPLYNALHIWSVHASVQKRNVAEIFFSRKTERRPKKIVLIFRILENSISSGKQTNKQKSHKSLLESFSKNTWKYTKLKYLDQLRKKTSIASLWSRSHSTIDNCSLLIRNKEYKSQATSYKDRLCSHSLLQSRRQHIFLSRSEKPAGGFKQFHNKLCMSFWMATEGTVFLTGEITNNSYMILLCSL